MVSGKAPHEIEEQDDEPLTAGGLLIEHYREVCKLSESKRERADALSAAQVTAATALGAILVTAAKSLPENQVPEAAAWGVLIALALTIVSALLTRATVVSLFLRERAREVRTIHNEARDQLAGLRHGGSGADASRQANDVQKAILRYWLTKTDVNEDAVRWKHHGGALAGFFLVLAVGMLGWIGVSILDDIW